MTDVTAPSPVPGIIDLHPRLQAGETLFGTFAGLGSPVATEIMRASRLRLADHRPRARRRNGVGAPREPPRRRCDIDRGPRPTGSPASGCASGAPSISVPTGSWSRGSTSPSRRARPSRSCATRRTGRAGSPSRPVAPGSASWVTPTSGRSTADPRASSRSSRPAPSSTRRRSPRSTASTSCSSARPTCRTASGSRAGSTIRPTSPPCERVVAAAEGAGKAAGILLRDAAALPRHRELGFRFIGLGSDGAFITDGARDVLAGARA